MPEGAGETMEGETARHSQEAVGRIENLAWTSDGTDGVKGGPEVGGDDTERGREAGAAPRLRVEGLVKRGPPPPRPHLSDLAGQGRRRIANRKGPLRGMGEVPKAGGTLGGTAPRPRWGTKGARRESGERRSAGAAGSSERFG